METLIMQLIGGLIGGNAAGALNKNASMGTGLNSIVGLIGGFGGTKLLALLPFLAPLLNKGGLDIGNIISQVASGGVGGLVLTMIAGMIKNAMGGGGGKA